MSDTARLAFVLLALLGRLRAIGLIRLSAFFRHALQYPACTQSRFGRINVKS